MSSDRPTWPVRTLGEADRLAFIELDSHGRARTDYQFIVG